MAVTGSAAESSKGGEHRRKSLSWMDSYWGVEESDEGLEGPAAAAQQQGEQEQAGADECKGEKEESPLQRSVSAQDHQQEGEGEAEAAEEEAEAAEGGEKSAAGAQGDQQ